MASRIATVPLSSPPGNFLLSAGFAGDTAFGPSGASATFAVNQAGTTLTIAGPSSAQVGTPSGVTALLKSGTTPLSFKTVWFVLTGPSTVTVAVDTNLAGVASLGNAPSVGGQYTITACFSKPSPAGTLPDGCLARFDLRPCQERPALPFEATWPFTGFFSPVDNLPTSTSPTPAARSRSSSPSAVTAASASSLRVVRARQSLQLPPRPRTLIEETSTALTNGLEFSGATSTSTTGRR